MSFKMSIDVGGTFTDLAFVDEKGEISIYKSSSTPPMFTEGMIKSIEVAAKARQLSIGELMKQCSASIGGSLIHGSTITTNAMIEGRVAKVGLICTRGFKDTLTIRGGSEKDNPYEVAVDYLPPYVPRYLTMEVTERVNSEGEIVIPLNEDDVRQAIRKLRNYNVEVIAVCLLWDIMNPTHERRIGEIIREEWSEVPFVLAVDLNPHIREVQRTSSTCINASLLPIVSSYFVTLESTLKEKGHSGKISMLTSAGGIMSVEESLVRPIYTIDCGPSVAPVAGQFFGNLEGNTDNIIVTDMGGTSFDVTCITNGEIEITKEAEINGYQLGIDKVDSRSIGAGGGSIAWVDAGGLCHVGPQSAGAVPGPVCYGRGGKEPTVTDADLILGFINPEYFVGGKMKLYPELAKKVLTEKIARPLGLSVEDAAYTVWSSVNVNMSTAVRNLTIWRGIDPHEYLIVAGGGAAGLHIPIYRELGARKVLLPKFAGGLSAVGGLFSDLVGNYSISFYTDSRQFNYKEVNDRLRTLEKKAVAFLDNIGVPQKKRRIEFYCEARYPYQVQELSVPLRVKLFNNEEDVTRLVKDFHDVHKRVFAVKEDTYIECIHWRVKATGVIEKPKIAEKPLISKDPSPSLVGKRRIYMGPELGKIEAKVYRGDKLRPGNEITSPSIIEEPTTTLVCFPGSKIIVTKYGDYLVEIE